jgi:broad-specificity NMP kinase
MKRLYIIGGTMGVGKTTVCQKLKAELSNCVFLDGDWCWDANPFLVNEETKEMVMHNICFMLNQFLHCSSYENVVFCWVMHEQNIIDTILANIDKTNCDIKVISLVCSQAALRERLEKDIQLGIRTSDVVERSIERLPLYDKLKTQKVYTDGKSVSQIVSQIEML